MNTKRRSTQYGQFLVLYFTVIGLWMCGEAVGKVCWVGNEPDQSGRMKFVLRENDPCSCTKIQLGGVSMTATGQHHHGHGSMPLYFNRPVMTEDADEIANLLNCNAADAEHPPACVSFNTTGYHYNYKFAALPKSADGGVRFEFSARAPNDVYISLVERNEDSAEGEVMYEILVGGWSDTKSVIRRSKQGSDLRSVVEEASGWLDGDTDKGFWVSAVPATNQGNPTLTISIGKGSEIDAFMTFEDHQPITVNYLGFSLWYGTTGSFRFCGLALRESTEVPETR